MAGRKHKEEGGWQKLKEKKTKFLESEASKCKKLTELFGRGGGTSVASSRRPDVEESEIEISKSDSEQQDRDVEGETARGSLAIAYNKLFRAYSLANVPFSPPSVVRA